MEEKLERFAEKLIELGDKIATAAEPGAKAALDATLTAVYVQSFMSIMHGVVLVLFSIGAAFLARRLLASASDSDDDMKQMGFMVAMIGVAMGGVVAGMGGIITLTKASTYMGVVYPEAALAVKILGL